MAVLSAERGLRHPAAQALVSEYQSQLVALENKMKFVELDVLETKNVPGLGVECTLRNGSIKMSIVVGSEWLLEGHGIRTSQKRLPQEQNGDANSRTQIYVAIDGLYAGRISCSDTIRPDARSVVARLQDQGCHVGTVCNPFFCPFTQTL